MMLSSIHACLLIKKSSILSAKYTSWFVSPPGPETVMKAAPARLSPELSATDIFNFGLIRSDLVIPILSAMAVPATHICAPVSARPETLVYVVLAGS